MMRGASHCSRSRSDQSMEATQASRANVVRSPREAAIGVATLSGLMLNRRERRMTSTMTRPSTKLARLAVKTELAQRSSPCSGFSRPVGAQPMIRPVRLASRPTTMP